MRLCLISEIDDGLLGEGLDVRRAGALAEIHGGDRGDDPPDVVVADAQQLTDPDAIERLRARLPEVSLVARVAGPDEGRASLAVGVDGTCGHDDPSDELSRVLEAALRARRGRMRWPRSFAERRLLVVAEEGDRWAEAAREAGFVAAHAGGLTEALAALRDEDPQVILGQLDVDGGRELLRAARCFDHGLGVVLLAEDAADAQALFDAGADAVLLPPLDVDRLAAGLERGWMRWATSRAKAVERPVLLAVGVADEPAKVLGAAAEAGEWTLATARDFAGAQATMAEHPVACLVLGDVGPADRLALRSSTDVPLVAWAAAAEGDRTIDAYLPPNCGAEACAAVVQPQIARGVERATLATILFRLHEVDGRRMRLIQQVADAQAELERLETVDHVTETLNRHGLELVLERSLAAAQRGGGSVAACLIDCDDFGRIEERFGRGAGDRVLREVAVRVKATLRQSDVIGRVGVDTFLVLLPRTRLAEAGLVAERARVAVSAEPLEIEDGAVQVSLSAGVAPVAWDTASLDELVAVAEVALAESKAAGKDQVAGGGDVGGSMSEMIGELVSGDALRAVAQPIVRLADGEVIAFEMLSRGREGLFEAPEQFLKLSRDKGVLTAVDLQCLKMCLSAAAEMPAHHDVHVNLYPTTLLDSSTEQLLTLIDAVEAPVCIELSEEQFVGDPRKLLDRIGALRAAGVRLAIDDVGKGRGTLDSVMLLEPELVKIDKDLTLGASRDVRKERLLRRLVALAGALGADVVAEGVEEEADLGLLRELDVPFAQGFFWAEPEPYEAP